MNLMNQYIVDTDVIETAVKKLKKLQGICKKYADQKLPTSSSDSGKAHPYMESLCQNYQQSWKEVSNLVERTCMFLNTRVESVLENDENASKALQK